MPVPAFVLLDVRSWWRNASLRWLMLPRFGVIAAPLCFHNTGDIQPGYYRYALDFVPIWLIVVASRVGDGPVRQRWTIAALARSMTYFNVVTRMCAWRPVANVESHGKEPCLCLEERAEAGPATKKTTGS